MISLKNLSYCYEGRDLDALRDVSIEFGRGSFTAIMGANSSGKSTLARCLNGLLQPTGGEVLVDGLNTKNAGSLSEIRRRVGFVFQDPNLQMTSATVERELAFGLQNVGLPIEGIREKVERELQRLNLVDRRNVSPSVLSGGERQRLALASVLMLEPEYLILDEPTSFLSPSSRKEVMRTLLALKDSKGIAIILITQFLNEAIQAERLIVLNKAEVALDGAAQRILQQSKKLTSLSISVPTNIHSFA